MTKTTPKPKAMTKIPKKPKKMTEIPLKPNNQQNTSETYKMIKIPQDLKND